MASAPMPVPMLAFPPESLVFESAAFRLRPYQRRVTGAVRLAESVPAGDQRDGLFVVHRHAGERFADISRRRQRVRVAVRTFRVDVDQAHLHRAERFRKLTFAAIAFVAEPRSFGAPVKLFGLPDIGAPAAQSRKF